MKKMLIASLALFTAFAVSAQDEKKASENKSETVEALEVVEIADEAEKPLTPEEKAFMKVGDDMMNYYLAPKPDEIPQMLAVIAKTPAEKIQNGVPSLMIFLGEVFRANDTKLEGWLKDIPNTPVMRFLVINALMYADTDLSKAALANYIKRFDELKNIKLPEERVTDISKLEMASPEMLDACWGGFFATGDAKYPEAVIRSAIREIPEDVIDLTSAAARWSVVSLSSQHKKVGEITKAYLKKATPEERKRFADGLANDTQMELLGEIIVPEKTEKE